MNFKVSKPALFKFSVPEHIGKPSGMLREVGAASSMAGEQTVDPRNNWHSSEYLRQRTTQLKPILKKLDPHDPVSQS